MALVQVTDRSVAYVDKIVDISYRLLFFVKGSQKT